MAASAEQAGFAAGNDGELDCRAPRRSRTSLDHAGGAYPDLGCRPLDREEMQYVAVAVTHLERGSRAFQPPLEHALALACGRHEAQVLRTVAHRDVVGVERDVVDADLHRVTR
jgi:hypothetical protein